MQSKICSRCGHGRTQSELHLIDLRAKLREWDNDEKSYTDRLYTHILPNQVAILAAFIEREGTIVSEEAKAFYWCKKLELNNYATNKYKREMLENDARKKKARERMLEIRCEQSRLREEYDRLDESL